MKTMHLLAAAGVLGLVAASAHAAVIDFTYEAGGITPMSNGYLLPANYGAEDGVSIIYNTFSKGWSSGSYSSPTNGGVAYASGQDTASITFTAPDDAEVQLLSFDVGHYKTNDAYPLNYFFTIDGVQGSLLTTSDGHIDLSNVKGQKVIFTYRDGPDSDHTKFGDWGIDNIEYQVVPEPATMGVLALGGAALLMSRKRKQS